MYYYIWKNQLKLRRMLKLYYLRAMISICIQLWYVFELKQLPVSTRLLVT